MPKIRRFQGCKKGEKLYFDWSNQATLEGDIIAAGTEAEKREARANHPAGDANRVHPCERTAPISPAGMKQRGVSEEMTELENLLDRYAVAAQEYFLRPSKAALNDVRFISVAMKDHYAALLARAEAAEAELAALKEAGRWRGYPDEKPPESGYYWTISECDDGSIRVDRKHYNTDGDVWFAFNETVANWLPIPAPPEPQL